MCLGRAIRGGGFNFVYVDLWGVGVFMSRYYLCCRISGFYFFWEVGGKFGC